MELEDEIGPGDRGSLWSRVAEVPADEGPCRTVGLTPKAYARVARLTAVVDTCRGQENVPWSQVSDFLPSQNPVDVDLDEQM